MNVWSPIVSLVAAPIVIGAWACAPKPAVAPSGGDSPCIKLASRFDGDFQKSLDELARAPRQSDLVREARDPANYQRYEEEMDDCCYFSMQQRNIPADGKFSECLSKQSGEVLRKTRF